MSIGEEYSERWQWDDDNPDAECKQISLGDGGYTTQDACERARKEHLRTLQKFMSMQNSMMEELFRNADSQKEKDILQQVDKQGKELFATVQNMAQNEERLTKLENQQKKTKAITKNIFEIVKDQDNDLKEVKKHQTVFANLKQAVSQKLPANQREAIFNHNLLIVIGILSVVAAFAVIYFAIERLSQEIEDVKAKNARQTFIHAMEIAKLRGEINGRPSKLLGSLQSVLGKLNLKFTW